ncbi:hypothetical protein AQUCO_08000013v1 [Aquilegia coerulea]|uniref:Cytochrome P450 n=1 Tax=Aquilegia coerulea TaxID=218851 RepID=A0A2G5C933_AQUCA|nr:hypothetical protein AQUCO_08000013v1 [Aquilegia coerulea]
MVITQKIVSLTVDIIARAAFGKTCEEKDAFISVVENIVRLTGGFYIADLFPSLTFLETIKMTHQRMDIAREHKKKGTKTEMTIEGEVQEDLVDVLLRIHEGEELEVPITMDTIKAVTFVRTDTSSTTLEWTFAELLRNPRIMEKAQAEVRKIFRGKATIDQADIDKLDYLRLVIKESLRLHPPPPLLVPRECSKTCEIDGYEIPKGSKVMVNVWVMGRDPENWKDPESFLPKRGPLNLACQPKTKNFKYIPFGAGRRACPGILFGIANIELPLALRGPCSHDDMIWTLRWQSFGPCLCKPSGPILVSLQTMKI